VFKKRLIIIGVIILFFALIYTLIPAHAFLSYATNNYRWNEHNIGISGAQIKDLIFDPNHNGTLYLVGSKGVYKTTDNGDTWVEKNTGLPASKTGINLLLDSSSDILYAVSYDAAGDQSFVYKTVDGGDHWVFASSGTSIPGYDGTGSKSYLSGATLESGSPQTLFAGTIIGGWHGGVFKSSDGAATWTQIAGSNIAGSGIGNDAWPLTIDSVNTNKMFAGTAYDGVFISQDGGYHWAHCAGTTGQIYALTIDPTDSNRIYAGGDYGLYLSSDAGSHWTLANQISGIVKAISVNPTNSQIVYLGIEGKGLWKSENYGASFTNLGSTTITINKIAVDQASPQNLFLATQSNGVYSSNDGGQTLILKNNGLPITVEARIIKSDSLGNLYAAVWGKGFYGSQNQGKDWELLSQATDILDFEIVPSNPQVIFYSGTSVMKSIDNGRNWQVLFTPSSDYLWALATDSFNPQNLFTAGNGGKMYKSSDNGQTWTQKMSFAPNGRVMDIQIDPTDSNRVYAAAYGYFWKSEDGGETWVQKTAGLTGTYANRGRYLAIDPLEPNIIYYDTQYGGIFRSDDYGENWNKLNLALGGGSPILNNIIIDSSDHAKIYVADYLAKRIYFSADKGENWETFEALGLPESLDALYWTWQDNIEPARFYAGFFYGGIYAFENYIADLTTSAVSASDLNGSPLEREDEVEYILNLVNSGWKDGDQISIEDNFSSFLDFVTGSIELDGEPLTQYTLNGNKISLALAKVQAKTNLQISLKYKVKADATEGGIVTNSFSITSEEDPAGIQFNSPNLTIVIVDNQPPTGSIAINSGSAYTTSVGNNILSLQATDDYSPEAEMQMMIANTSDFSNTTWEPFTASESWTLTPGEGTKTVYVKYMDSHGNVSPVYSDSIIYDPQVILTSVTAAGLSVDVDAGVYETMQRKPVFSGISDAGAQIIIKVLTALIQVILTADDDGYWSWIPAEDLSIGQHLVEISAQDMAGNTASLKFYLKIATSSTENQKNTDAANDPAQLPKTGWVGFSLIFGIISVTGCILGWLIYRKNSRV